MKYGIIPTRLAERIALWAGQVPIPLIDCTFSLIRIRAIMAGVSLGLFEALKDGPRRAAEVAAGLGLDPGVTEELMRVLAHSDYLDWKDGAFTLSSLSRKSMVAGSPRELTGYVRWNYPQWDMLAGLEALARTGRGLDFHETMKGREDWGHYQRGMLELARFQAPIVASRVPIRPGATRLLDVAGSHGLFGAALCRKHPPMMAEVLDLPEAVEHARLLAREEKIDDVVVHRSGDLRREEFGGPYDAVLLSNILHHFLPAENREWIAKARRALGSGGTVAIWEFEAPDRDRPPTEIDGAALFFRLTSTARCHSAGEYAGWVQEAGFRDVRVARPVLSPGSILVTGRV